MSWVAVAVGGASLIGGIAQSDAQKKANKANAAPKPYEETRTTTPWGPTEDPLKRLIGSQGNFYDEIMRRYMGQIPGYDQSVLPGGIPLSSVAPYGGGAPVPAGGGAAAGPPPGVDTNDPRWDPEQGKMRWRADWRERMQERNQETPESGGRTGSPAQTAPGGGGGAPPGFYGGTSDPRELMRRMSATPSGPDVDAIRGYTGRIMDPNYRGNVYEQMQGDQLSSMKNIAGYDALNRIANERAYNQAPPRFYSQGVGNLLAGYQGRSPRQQLLAGDLPTRRFMAENAKRPQR